MSEQLPIIPHVEMRQIEVSEAGQRIDNFLLRILKGVPKSRIYRALRSGEVRANKKRIKPTYKIMAGDVIRIPPIRTALRPVLKLQPELAAVLHACIIYEDADLLVLNKPCGLAVHAGSGMRLGVIEALRLLYPEETQLELVHRLDRETSGCLMVAKNRDTLQFLHTALRAGTVAKKYLTVLVGDWPRGETLVDVPLQKNVLSSGERMVMVDEEGKSAQTLFRLLENQAELSLVEVTLLTGRTHQIRVHAAYKGHPVAGDEKYGDKTANKQLREQGLKRLFLHASQLVIPSSQAPDLHVHAPLDQSLAIFLKLNQLSQEV